MTGLRMKPKLRLTTRTSANRVAAEHLQQAPDDVIADWKRLLAKLKPGDELWEFEPASASGYQLWGVALVRRGEIKSKLILALD